MDRVATPSSEGVARRWAPALAVVAACTSALLPGCVGRAVVPADGFGDTRDVAFALPDVVRPVADARADADAPALDVVPPVDDDAPGTPLDEAVASPLDEPSEDDEVPGADVVDAGSAFDVPPLDADVWPLPGSDAALASSACAPDGAPAAGAAPRPIAPLSTAIVMTSRPTLEWELAPGTDGARVELCSARSCASVERSYDATGARLTVPVDLAPGVHFWRLFARTGDAAAPTPGPVWQFYVPVHPAGRDVSWGHVPDFNGDGRPDIVVTSPEGTSPPEGRVYVFYTDPAGGAWGAPQELRGALGGSQPGHGVASAGDVDGDGFADLVVAGPTSQHAALFRGSAAGLVPCSEIVLARTDPMVSPGFGSGVDSAGDTNRDGYADVIVGDPGFDGTNGAFWIYLGGADGLSEARARQYTDRSATEAWPAFGTSVTSAGDLDGDGFGDVAVAFGDRAVSGARVYRGSAAGLTAAGALDALAGSIAGAGDLNGDGLADLVSTWAAWDGSRARLDAYYGDPSGHARWLPVPTPAGTTGQLLASGVGDVDGDGFGDLVVGSSVGDWLALYRGTSRWLDVTPVPVVLDPDPPHGLVSAFGVSAGDLDDDGVDDLLIGLPVWDGEAGAVFVQFGGASLPRATSVLFAGSPAERSQFGSAIAGAF